MVLEGGVRFIERFRPDFFIELHGITCTMPVLHFLNAHRYHVRVLEEHAENRLFIHAAHRPDLFQGPEARSTHLAGESELVRRAVAAVKRRDAEIETLLEHRRQNERLGVELARIRAHAEEVTTPLLSELARLRVGYDGPRDAPTPVGTRATPSHETRIERVLIECSCALAAVHTSVIRARSRTPLGLMKRAFRKLRRMLTRR